MAKQGRVHAEGNLDDFARPTNLQSALDITSFTKTSRFTGAVALVLGVFVLFAWYLDSAALKSILPRLDATGPNAALCLVLLGITLWLDHDGKFHRARRYLAYTLVSIVLLVGILTLIEYGFQVDPGIDQLLFRDLQAAVPFFPGRMSLSVALCFSLISLGILLIEARHSRQHYVGQFMVLACGSIAFMVLIGYLYSPAVDSSMAVHTAAGFILLALGALYAHPQRGLMRMVSADTLGGAVLRRLLPLAILVPVAIGWAGSLAEQAGLYDTNFGLALMVVLRAAVLSVIIWQNAKWIDRVDRSRRQLEQQYAESQLQKAGVINSAMDAIISITEDQRIMSFNPAAEMMFQYPAEKVIGRPLSMLIPERLAGSHPGHVRAFGQTSVTRRSMGRLGMVHGRRSNGEEFPLEVSISQLDADGKKIFTAILRDITEREQAANAMRASEERYRMLIEQASDGIFISDAEGNYVEVNPSGCAMLGYSHEEITRLNFHDLVDPEEVNSVAMRLNELKEGKSIRTERRLRRKDGSTIFAEIGARMLRDGHLQAIVRDITERKQTEEILRASETRYRNTLDNMLEGAQIISPDWRYLYVNEAVVKNGRQRRENLLYHTMMEAYPGIEDTRLFSVLRECMRDRKPMEMENQFVYSDGSTAWFELSIQPVDEGLFILSVDITSRKQAEEEIRRLNAELEERVRLRTSQLEAANKELEAFSYSISHDLRAPLRSIDGFSRILLEDYADRLDSEGQRYLNVVRESTQQMGHLIDDLLTFSRLSRQVPEMRGISLTDLVRQVVVSLQTEQEGRQIRITIGDLPPCRGDPILLKQVFINLLTNALKFTRQREMAEIEVGSKTMEGEQVYYVKDNGAGFDMQYADKLFGVFQRLHRAEEFEGTGVGLAIVQRILHRHGGRIWAEGETDQGATFFLTLPGADAGRAKPSFKDRFAERAKDLI